MLENILGWTVCRVFGHRFAVQKMSGWLCSRCRVFSSERPR